MSGHMVDRSASNAASHGGIVGAPSPAVAGTLADVGAWSLIQKRLYHSTHSWNRLLGSFRSVAEQCGGLI